jgi:hypothetical protein
VLDLGNLLFKDLDLVLEQLNVVLADRSRRHALCYIVQPSSLLKEIVWCLTQETLLLRKVFCWLGRALRYQSITDTPGL